jgi:glycosyltransferase involved in cell wall biosynthesis
MRFSIITPCFHPSPWLPVCIASVAEQGVDAEHIVQDAGSKDGTLDWLPGDRRVSAFVEADSGMYDAVNRGLRRAEGEILAYLNCDEQYLPGALAAVDGYFRAHPSVDVLFGDVVVVDPAAHYMFHRKVLVPLAPHTAVAHLSVLTCAIFFRRAVVDEHGLFFDATLRDVGDAEWMLRLLQRGLRMATIRQFTSAFTQTGDNMGARPNAVRERLALRAKAPLAARALRPLLVLHHRLRRLAGGIYVQRPFHYSVYTQESPDRRVTMHADRPGFRWRNT